MQALSTGKTYQEKVQFKGILQNKLVEIVHIDLVAPTRIKGLKGEQHFMLLVDDYTRMTAVFFLNKNSEALENFKTYKEMVDTKKELKIKCLILENVGEFT
jgi:hypothetical protein